MAKDCNKENCIATRSAVTLIQRTLNIICKNSADCTKEQLLEFLEEIYAGIENTVKGIYWCGTCKLPYSDDGVDWIGCDGCGCWFHQTISCAENFPKSDLNSTKWLCKVCTTFDRKNLDSDTEEDYEDANQSPTQITSSPETEGAASAVIPNSGNVFFNNDNENSDVPKFEPRKTNTNRKGTDIKISPVYIPNDYDHVILASSQGRHIDENKLDPTGRTKLFVYPGMTIKKMIWNLKQRNRIAENVQTVSLLMGGNDLSQFGLNNYLNSLDEVELVLKDLCPNATFYVMDVLPRNDCPDYSISYLCLEEWAKHSNLSKIIRIPTISRKDIANDGVHLNSTGVRKLCRAIKQTLNLPAVRKRQTISTGNNRRQAYKHRTNQTFKGRRYFNGNSLYVNANTNYGQQERMEFEVNSGNYQNLSHPGYYYEETSPQQVLLHPQVVDQIVNKLLPAIEERMGIQHQNIY